MSMMRNLEKEQIRFLENIASDGFVGLEEIVYDGCYEFDGCKKEWNLGTPVSIVRMVRRGI